MQYAKYFCWCDKVNKCDKSVLYWENVAEKATIALKIPQSNNKNNKSLFLSLK